jgi:hypothetical protein
MIKIIEVDIRNYVACTRFNWFDLLCLTPLSAIFQLYHGDQLVVVEEAGVLGENHRPSASNW